MGSREGGGEARCVVREVQPPARPQRENGAAGGDSDATDADEAEEEAGPADPSTILYTVEWLGGEGGAPTDERTSLYQSQLRRPAAGSPLAALPRAMLQRWMETVATAEPVAVRLLLLLLGWRGCKVEGQRRGAAAGVDMSPLQHSWRAGFWHSC